MILMLYICAFAVLIWLHGFWAGRRFDETAEMVRCRLSSRIHELEAQLQELREELHYSQAVRKRNAETDLLFITNRETSESASRSQ